MVWKYDPIMQCKGAYAWQCSLAFVKNKPSLSICIGIDMQLQAPNWATSLCKDMYSIGSSCIIKQPVLVSNTDFSKYAVIRGTNYRLSTSSCKEHSGRCINYAVSPNLFVAQ